MTTKALLLTLIREDPQEENENKTLRISIPTVGQKLSNHKGGE